MNASPAIPEVIFTNPAPITIPGGPAPGSPYPSNIAVSGITSPVTKVTVTLTGMTHTWPDDIGVLVVGPTGVKVRLMIDSGFNFEINGVNLTFDDAAAGTLPNSGQIVTGTFRPSTGTAGPGEGAAHPANFPAPAPAAPYSLTLASFNGVNPNGTWSLFVDDDASGDSGAISGGWSLNITADAAVPVDANVDMNGDGKTDYVVARATETGLTEATAPSLLTPGLNFDTRTEVKGRRRSGADSLGNPPIFWYTSINGTGAVIINQLGDAATDFITPEDFDGDGKDDIAVWTEAPATQANFKILQSTTSTVRVETFGQTGDDPAVVGDYDGDGKADPAVYRCPSGSAGQCFFFYRGSLNNPGGGVTFGPWGFGVDGDFFPNVGDFDGDGKHDFCIQRANPDSPANGQFVLLKSAGGVEFINWGLATDFILPGDYDADGKSDFMVRRTVGVNRQHWLLTRTGAISATTFGISGDASVPGDYDGDGKTDIAIWRGSTDPTQNFFWVLSSGTGTISAFEWGQCASVSTCDFPVAQWAVH